MSDASTATNDAAADADTGGTTTAVMRQDLERHQSASRKADEDSTGPYRRPVGLVEAYRLGREHGMQEPKPIDAFTPEQADAYRRGVADARTVAACKLSPATRRARRHR